MKECIPTFYEFFAGGGMARAGLGPGWQCTFANEIDAKKSETYQANWPHPDVLKVADVRSITSADIAGVADLAWASFPCQDLSLAGAGAGLQGDRSGTFWPFWKLIEILFSEGRAPRMVVLENVSGTITSHGGADFSAICDALSSVGYRFGPLVVDAVHFVPQSRPRLFVVGVRQDVFVNTETLVAQHPTDVWHPKALIAAYRRLGDVAKTNWIWWNLARPETRSVGLIDLIEENPDGVTWHTDEETERLLALMDDLNRRKVNRAKRLKTLSVGTIYKRTRENEAGQKIQRAEVRFDNISGCLRTPAGGSSRQVVLIVHGNSIRSRLISPRETARLMGLPDTYRLPSRYNEAYHLTGDGVVVPVVRHLAHHILEPLLRQDWRRRQVAA